MKNKWIRCDPDPDGKRIAWYYYSRSNLEFLLFKDKEGAFFSAEIRDLQGDYSPLASFSFPGVKTAREAKKEATKDIKKFLAKIVERPQLLSEEL